MLLRVISGIKIYFLHVCKFGVYNKQESQKLKVWPSLHDTHHYFKYIDVIDTLYFVSKQGKSESVT